MGNKNCGKKHGHWGKNGAAGLLIHRYRDTGEVEMFLAKHVRKESDNNVWGTIGGGMEPGETVQECALREAEEEVGIKFGDCCKPTALTVDDHDTWKYTTISATPVEGETIGQPILNKHEISEVAWVSRRELGNYGLHQGFEFYLMPLLDILLPPDIDRVKKTIVPPNKRDEVYGGKN
ncbi:hypothetical protein F5Y02DRAFT_418997 [Annulohypoxylon stygium]|nr:hypothetical protein F5Y02DRAFT_418997 [Annulohypoxylon stygium]